MSIKQEIVSDAACKAWPFSSDFNFACKDGRVITTRIYYCPLVISPTITNCCKELHLKFGWVCRSVFENAALHKNYSSLVWKPVLLLILSKSCTFTDSHSDFLSCSLQYDEMFLISLLDGCYEFSQRFKVKISCERVKKSKK